MIAGLVGLLTMVGVVIECGMVYSVWKRGFYPAVFYLHLTAVVFFITAAYLYFFRLYGKKTFAARHLFALVTVAFFSWFGLLTVLVFYLAGLARRTPDAVDEAMEIDREELAVLRREFLQENESLPNVLRRVRSEISFQPFIDILKGREARAKSKAIVILSRTISAENVRLLKGALKDRAPEVRLYAASALLKIESELNRKIQKAKLQSVERGTEKDYNELGDLYMNYAQLGITDTALSEYYLRLAADAFRSSLDIRTEQVDVTLHYSTCLLALKQDDKVKKLLDHAMSLWPKNRDIVFLRNQVYFNLGLYAEISPAFARIADQPLAENQRKVCEFWTS